ncbi:MAG: HlyC/CorC family transporter [Rhizobiales bacterium]|nr:HlyC/CorC family transporter [Hyphomicrobiales bacterium]
MLANGFFVAAEFSLVAVRRSRVDQLVAEGRAGAARLKRAVDHLDSHLAATQLGITMSSIALGWIGEPALAGLIEPLFAGLPQSLAWLATHTVAVVIAFAIITTLHIVIGELMPKSLALQRSERTALATAGPLRVYLIMFWPAIKVLNGLGNGLLRVFGLQPGSGEELLHSAEELKLLVSATHEAGMLHKTQHEVVDRVFTLEHQKIASYMTPRMEVEWFDLDANPEEWRRAAATSEHSQLPLGKGTVNHVIGIVRAKDVLLAEALDAVALKRMAEARPIVILLESSLVLTAFEHFRATGTGMGIVVDELGEFLGLITLTNLLEAFVGDLPEADELADANPVRAGDGSWTLDGMLPINEVKRILGLRELTPRAGTGYHTLAGFVIELLRKLPRTGDVARWEGLSFEVTKIDGRRIDQVVVRPQLKT